MIQLRNKVAKGFYSSNSKTSSSLPKQTSSGLKHPWGLTLPKSKVQSILICFISSILGPTEFLVFPVNLKLIHQS